MSKFPNGIHIRLADGYGAEHVEVIDTLTGINIGQTLMITKIEISADYSEGKGIVKAILTCIADGIEIDVAPENITLVQESV